MTACDHVEEALGALVLGALEPGERDLVETHVASCPPCAAALAELAPLPALLNRAAAAESAPAPAYILDRALDQIHEIERGRRRRRVVLMAAAAAILAVLSTTLVVHSLRPPVSVTATGSQAAVTAKVVLTPVPSGTSLSLTLQGVRPGEHCELVAVSPAGVHDVASSWVATYDGEASVTGMTALELADISRLDVTTPEGEILVSLPVGA